MKLAPIALIASFLFASLAARADSAQIADLVGQFERFLGEDVHGVSRRQVRPGSAEQMLLEYQDDGETTVVNYPTGKDFPEVDGGQSTVGLMKIDDVLILALTNVYGRGLPKGAYEKIESQGRAILVRIKQAGGLLGYVSQGSSVCGSTLPSAVIIDKESGTIYEILAVGGEC